jgi:UDP-N-acetylglucosamine:LPS N-acetylglucosamine transferase
VDRWSDAPVFCVVTDTDVHRVWAPYNGPTSRVQYLVPSSSTGDRIRSYGVRSENVLVTGFPLPPSLERDAERNLQGRLERLSGIRFSGVRDADSTPLLTFAVGGAGAQAERGRQLLRALVQPLRAGALRLALVAGTRPRLAARFRKWCKREVGEDWSRVVEILEATSFESYYRRFNSLLERTDTLWTKPSELVFYAALGLPLILDNPVGAHERANTRWVLDAGAGVFRPSQARIRQGLERWFADGTLAECARSGYSKLPRGGVGAIAEKCSILVNKNLTTG